MKFTIYQSLFWLFSFQLCAQSHYGVVLDGDLIPLAGVTVMVDQTNYGTTTDDDGRYVLSLKPATSNIKLKFSYIGFNSVERSFTIDDNYDLGTVVMSEQTYVLESLTIKSLRNTDDAPFVFQNFDKADIAERNLGQDIPELLSFTPSVVSTSDAGAGIGYTALRIRGSDASRVNVTINGVPFNDSESQQVFWVNLPDFSSSVQDIQIQRGVGTSTNGSGAFGASINMSTFTNENEPYAKLDNTLGSFNTRKHSLSFGTGLISDHFNIEGRLSMVKSDGYINRASSDLKSYFLSGSYNYASGFLRFTNFKGHEVTYQSWNGTPESRALDDVTGINNYCERNFLSDSECQRLFDEGRQYNFYTYENQVDNYQQNHFQLHWNHELSDQWIFSANSHYTKGKGYFEQFKDNEDFSDYGLDNPVINGAEIQTTNLVRRRWLDNDFYGAGLNLRYEPDEKLVLDLGTAWNNYVGAHFGEIIRADILPNIFNQANYYDNEGEKMDFSAFIKLNYVFNPKLSLYGDIQFRRVGYAVLGVDNDLRLLQVDQDFNFFNPKAGINYRIDDYSKIYASVALANREPDRNDFVDALDGNIPKHESLTDFEIGYQSNGKINYGANLYYMHYQNQLVLTGNLNDVGAPIRTNVDRSHRLGLELYGSAEIGNRFSLDANLTWSQNKIASFDELIFDYTNGFDIISNPFSNTDISFSPSLISSLILTWEPIKNLRTKWYSKIVGKQFLDNTSNELRKLSGYNVHNFQLIYDLGVNDNLGMSINLMVNNVFSTRYSANGYTYSFIFEDLITENFLYPQAERNLLLGLSIRI